MRGRITSRTVRRLRSRALRMMSWPSRLPPGRRWVSISRSSSSECAMTGRGAGFDAGAAQEPLGAMIEQPVGRIKNAIEPMQRRGGPQRHRQRALDGKPFRPQFAQDNLQKSHHRKTDGEGDVSPRARRLHPAPIQQGPEQGGENRLGEPAQPQAGHGDAQLGGAEIGGQILQNVPGQPRAPVALHDQGVQLRVAQFDKGEFRGDEKAVDQHDGQDAQTPASPAQLRAWPSIYKFTSPKMTRRMSCRLINPVSPWSALKTIAQAAAGRLHPAQGLFQAQFLGQEKRPAPCNPAPAWPGPAFRSKGPTPD